MDPTHRLPLIYQSTEPPPPPSSSGANLPIFAICILGVVSTSALLLNYYVIVIKCCRQAGRPSTQRNNVSPTVQIAPDEPLGLDPSAIRAIPVVRYEAKRSSSSPECAVCLNEFSEEESHRLLPNCSHIFHVDCIDTWLQSNASCPLCRSGITNPTPPPFPPQSPPRQEHVGSVVIEVGGDGGGDRSPRGEASSSGHNPSPRRRESGKKRKRMHQVSSMGDECADSRGGYHEVWLVRPWRRSFSVDSCCDRRLHAAVQEMLQQNPGPLRWVGSSGDGGGGRLRRPFFSFGQGRSPREAVLPTQIGL